MKGKSKVKRQKSKVKSSAPSSEHFNLGVWQPFKQSQVDELLQSKYF